jgi:hypothetical protein
MSNQGVLGIVIAGLGLLVTIVAEGINEEASSQTNEK